MPARCACCTHYGLSPWRWRAPGNSIRGRIDLETATPLLITEAGLGRLCRLGRCSNSAVIGDPRVGRDTAVINDRFSKSCVDCGALRRIALDCPANLQNGLDRSRAAAMR